MFHTHTQLPISRDTIILCLDNVTQEEQANSECAPLITSPKTSRNINGVSIVVMQEPTTLAAGPNTLADDKSAS